MTTTVRALNGLLMVALSLILGGAFYFQFVDLESPCPLCYLQRVAMIGVAIGALLNLSHTIRPSHYALSLIWAFFGAGVALRQIGLHACPQFERFGVPFLGLSLFTWSFITQCGVILFIALLLFLEEKALWDRRLRKLNRWEILAATLLILVTAGNIAATFAQCFIGPCQD